MLTTLSQKIATRLSFCVIILSVFLLSACSTLESMVKPITDLLPAAEAIPIPRSQTIYIQSMTGQNLTDFQAIFFDTIKEQDSFEFVELLPDDLSDLQILRLEIKDFSIWENEELSPAAEEDILSLDSKPDVIVRRNANISIKVSLFNAETGKRLINRVFAHPYQQIYIGEEAIDSRPDRLLELNRLTRLTVFSMLSAFKMDREEHLLDRLEDGVSEGWTSEYVMDFGDSRIKKGNRFARAEEFDQAILVWKLALFQPTEYESSEISLRNRATAYYNLGVLYSYQDNWWLASEMFSRANRLHQKIKYAQAWGESIQRWLDIKKNPDLAKPIASIELDAEQEQDEAETILLELPKTVQSIEKNDQLLLSPRELWPLEPELKDLESFDADY